MTKVVGTLRSTETQESEGSGDNISEARQAAIAGLNLEGFELQQANTVTSKATGETTIKARLGQPRRSRMRRPVRTTTQRCRHT